MSLNTLKVSGTSVRRLSSLALAAGLTVTVAACGSSSHTASPKAKSVSPAAVSTPAAVAKTSAPPVPHVNLVKVTASNDKLALSSTAFHAGSYTFRETNSGTTKHALTILGPGLTNKPTSATLTPGQTSDLIVPLTKGSYELWSPIGTDKAKGLVAHITVS
jgi:uncharacterized cupredoxin-like copper-binding protein